MNEFFAEGGPAFGRPCTPDGPCRIWPRTDLFTPSACRSEADWPQRWAVNQ